MRKAGGLYIFSGVIILIGAIIIMILALIAKETSYFITFGVYFVMATIQISVGVALKNDAKRIDEMTKIFDLLNKKRKILEDQIEELKLEIRDLKKKNNDE